MERRLGGGKGDPGLSETSLTSPLLVAPLEGVMPATEGVDGVRFLSASPHGQLLGGSTTALASGEVVGILLLLDVSFEVASKPSGMNRARVMSLSRSNPL